MSVKFQKQYFSFNRILEKNVNEEHPKRSYAKVLMSSSWKTGDGTRKYSDWIARFIGDAFQMVSTLEKKDFIMCSGSFTREGYEKGDKKVWPDASMTIFECKKWQKEEVVELPPEEDLPF
jgi:hypothetical protein